MAEGDYYKKVRMSPELMNQLFVRTREGFPIRIEWGEMDDEGFYCPTFHIEYQPLEELLAGITKENTYKEVKL